MIMDEVDDSRLLHHGGGVRIGADEDDEDSQRF